MLVCAGVVSGDLMLSDQTVLGEWNIEVQAAVSSVPIHTHMFNGPLSGTTRVSRYQKGKTSLDFTGARDSEWQ